MVRQPIREDSLGLWNHLTLITIGFIADLIEAIHKYFTMKTHTYTRIKAEMAMQDQGLGQIEQSNARAAAHQGVDVDEFLVKQMLTEE